MQQAIDEAGNIWPVDAQGNVTGKSLGNVNQRQGIQIKPSDPTRDLARPKAQTELQGSGLENDIKRSTLRDSNQGTLEKNFRWVDAAHTRAEPVPGSPADPNSPNYVKPNEKSVLTAATRADAITGYQAGQQLLALANDMEAKFKAGPGQTSGLSGIQDFLPTVANRRFDQSGQRARAFVKQALGFTGGEGNTASESQINYGPFLPSSSNFDETAQDKIAALRELAAKAMTRGTAILGGVPDANGNIVPADQGQDAPAPDQNRDPMIGANIMGNPTGGTSNGPPPSPKTLPDGQKFAYDESGQPIGILDKDGNWLSGYGSIHGKLDPAQEDNNARQGSTLDAFTRGATDLLTLGGVNKISAGINSVLPIDALTGRDVQSVWGGKSLGDAYRHNIGLENRTDAADENVNAMPRFLGQATGAVLGGYGAAKALPGFFGSETAMLAPRAIGADAGMGAVYEGNKAVDQGRDVLPAAAGGAAMWAGGGALGRGVGNIAGRAISGVTNPAVQRLRAAGVKMSPGQMVSQSGVGITGRNLAGGALKSAEDVGVGAGPLGAGFRAQRDASLEGLNRAAFNDGMAPVGGKITKLGEDGIMQARAARSQGYSNALDGANITEDLPTLQAINGIAKQADKIKGMEGEFRATLADRVGSQFDHATRTMDGRGLQAAIRGLRTDAKSADRNSNFMRSDQFGNATRATEAELMRLAESQNPGIKAGYDAANKANMNYEILRGAVRAGKNQDGRFSAAQLRSQADRAAEKFGGNGGTTNVPFYQLTKDAQAILPSKMSDSGTAGRAATLALPLLVGGGSGAASAAGYIDPKTAALLTAIAGLSSPLGRSAAEAALLKRPAVAKNVGKAIRRKSGLFGAVSAPVLSITGE